MRIDLIGARSKHDGFIVGLVILSASFVATAGGAQSSRENQRVQREPMPSEIVSVTGQRLWRSAESISVQEFNEARQGGISLIDDPTSMTPLAALVMVGTAGPAYERDGCIAVGPVAVTWTVEIPQTLVELAQRAQGGYECEVLGRQVGFHGAEPGTLLKLRVTDEIKGRRVGPLPDETLLFYPAAEAFDAGGVRFCRNNPAVPPVPQVGSRVLFLPVAATLDKENLMFYPAAQGVFTEVHGVLGIPEVWSRDDFLRQARKTMSMSDIVSFFKDSMQGRP